MTKRKPRDVFAVTGPTGETVVVLARHAKGARTVAGDHIDGLNVHNSTVRPLGNDSACRAVNWKQPND